MFKESTEASIFPTKAWIQANRDATATLENERVPTLEELRTILLHAPDRAKVMISMIAIGGMRLETLGNQDASDGLIVGDLPELRRTPKEPPPPRKRQKLVELALSFAATRVKERVYIHFETGHFETIQTRLERTLTQRWS